MEKECLGFKVSTDNEKIQLEISIENLISGFNGMPNKCEGYTIDKNKKQEFANYVAETLISQSDSETGNSPIMDALDSVFEEAIETVEDFINFDEV